MGRGALVGVCALVVWVAWSDAEAEEAKTSTPAPSLEKILPKVSGYLQPAFTLPPNGDTGDWSFFLRRVRIRFSGEVVVPELTYTILVDPFASRPLFDGFIAVKYIPHHEVRLGQFKVLFGWENPASSTILPTIERTLVSDRLGRGPNLRDIGVGLFANIPLVSDLRLEYGATFVNGAGANRLEDSPGKDLFGRLGLAWGKILRFGASGSRVKTFRDGEEAVIEESFRVGADVLVEYGPVFFVAEYIHGFFTEPAKQRRNGFYATLLGHAPFGLEGVVRFEQYDPDLSAPDDVQRRLTFGLNYLLFGHSAKAMLNYRHDLQETRDHLLLAQVQYMF
jgi:hypothetical protein